MLWFSAVVHASLVALSVFFLTQERAYAQSSTLSALNSISSARSCLSSTVSYSILCIYENMEFSACLTIRQLVLVDSLTFLELYAL